MSDDEVRTYERQVAANPSAESLSNLAFALARVGRLEESFEAATRAMNLDRGAAARPLLRATWTPNRWVGSGTQRYDAVTWGGLSRLRAPQALESVPGGEIDSEILDAGSGRIIYSRRDELLCVDIFDERQVWRRQNYWAASVHEGTVVALKRENGALQLHRLSSDSGEPVAAVVDIRATGPLVAIIDDRRFVVEHLVDAAPPWVTKRITYRTFDGLTGERVGEFELPSSARSPEVDALEDGLLVRYMGGNGSTFGAFARSITGAMLRGPLPHRVDRIGRRLVAHGPDRTLLVFEDGRDEPRQTGPHSAQGRVWCANEQAVVLNHQGKLVVLDPETLDQLWSSFDRELAHVPYARRAVATRDALIVVGVGSDAVPVVAALDARNGAELSRVPFRGAGRNPLMSWYPRLALVAGRLVIGSAVREEVPLLVLDGS